MNAKERKEALELLGQMLEAYERMMYRSSWEDEQFEKLRRIEALVARA
jgi:hypothetical protein